jgi:hypothetical protein
MFGEVQREDGFNRTYEVYSTVVIETSALNLHCLTKPTIRSQESAFNDEPELENFFPSPKSEVRSVVCRTNVNERSRLSRTRKESRNHG